MKRIISFVLAISLVFALGIGASLSVSADFKYPSAYWKLHDAWAAAIEKQDSEKVLTVVKQTYDLLMPIGYCQDVCYNLGPKTGRASWLCEAKGDIDGAIMWLERYIDICKWLDKNVVSYRDAILDAEARMYYLKAAADPTIYALTDQPGKSYSNSGALASGTFYGSSLGGSFESDSSALVYVNFRDGYSVDYWLGYYKNTSEQFNHAINNGGIIELAWNFSPEGTAGCERVLEADSDAYISEGLASMASLGATVLLRVGAEMNNWADCNTDTYIKAFRKVATAARAYSNIKLVFSPDNVSNRNRNFADFYPGDEYVDWIGVSTYHNSNYTSYSGSPIGYGFAMTNYNTDAYYGMGIYDGDPLVIIRPIADFAAKHNKPMMISECGFAYKNKNGADLTAFAKDQMTKFYSYVNMIYPQVKAVYYFDNTLNGGNAYRLAENGTINQTYRSVIAQNGGYVSAGQTSSKTWHELSELKSAQNGSARLATYASFSGTAQTSVTYYVDGKAVTTSTTAPYYYNLDVSGLSAGEHTVWATAKSGQFTRTTETYTINVSGSQWNWVPTKAPETTAAPVTTKAPETTSAPVMTAAPVTTPAPETIAEPETTLEPETVAEPETADVPDTDTDTVEDTADTTDTPDTAEAETTVTDEETTAEDFASESEETTAPAQTDEKIDIGEDEAGLNPGVIVVFVAAGVAVIGAVVAFTKKKGK